MKEIDIPHLTNNIGLNSQYPTWKHYLEQYTKFCFSYHCYDVYVAVNSYYFVDQKGAVFSDIFGYGMWKVLAEFTETNISEIRDQYDTKREFELDHPELTIKNK